MKIINTFTPCECEHTYFGITLNLHLRLLKSANLFLSHVTRSCIIYENSYCDTAHILHTNKPSINANLNSSGQKLLCLI